MWATRPLSVRKAKGLDPRTNRLKGISPWSFGIHDPYLEEAAHRAGYRAAFAYEGGTAEAGCDFFAIPRIPISDKDTGARFSRLLGPKTAGKKER